MYFTTEQTDQLLKPLNPSRVHQAQGQSHLPAWDVTAHLTRLFGFGGWEKEILSLELVHETETTTNAGKPAWAVTYGCVMRLHVRDCEGNALAIDDAATGSSKQPQRGDTHDMAMKSAISYALKRCAKDLGDQFGLSLYNGGMVKALVGKTLVGVEATTTKEELAPEHEILSEGIDEGETTRVEYAPPAEVPEVDKIEVDYFQEVYSAETEDVLMGIYNRAQDNGAFNADLQKALGDRKNTLAILNAEVPA